VWRPGTLDAWQAGRVAAYRDRGYAPPTGA